MWDLLKTGVVILSFAPYHEFKGTPLRALFITSKRTWILER